MFRNGNFSAKYKEYVKSWKQLKTKLWPEENQHLKIALSKYEKIALRKYEKIAESFKTNKLSCSTSTLQNHVPFSHKNDFNCNEKQNVLLKKLSTLGLGRLSKNPAILTSAALGIFSTNSGPVTISGYNTNEFEFLKQLGLVSSDTKTNINNTSNVETNLIQSDTEKTENLNNFEITSNIEDLNSSEYYPSSLYNSKMEYSSIFDNMPPESARNDIYTSILSIFTSNNSSINSNENLDLKSTPNVETYTGSPEVESNFNDDTVEFSSDSQECNFVSEKVEFSKGQEFINEVVGSPEISSSNNITNTNDNYVSENLVMSNQNVNEFVNITVGDGLTASGETALASNNITPETNADFSSASTTNHSEILGTANENTLAMGTNNMSTLEPNIRTEQTNNLITSEIDPIIEAIPEPPVVPDAAAELANSLNALGEPTFASLGLGGWSPVGIVQNCFEYLHVGLGIPWWEAIAIGTLIIRFLMFPLVVVAQRNAAKMNNYLPQMQVIQLKMTEARQSGNQLEVARYSQELMAFMKEKNVNPFKNMLVPLAQMPVFISFFVGLRQMSNVPVDSLRDGGLFWFTDLTVPDQFFALPVITSLTLWATIELGTDSAKLSSQNLQTMKYVLRALPFIILPFTVNFPGAILCYWVSSNFISLAQVGFLRIPAVRDFFKIDPLIAHNPKNLPIKNKGFVGGIKDSWTNIKITKELEERKRLDELQFQRAGKGPLIKTYKYDPTKQTPKVATKSS